MSEDRTVIMVSRKEGGMWEPVDSLILTEEYMETIRKGDASNVFYHDTLWKFHSCRMANGDEYDAYNGNRRKLK